MTLDLPPSPDVIVVQTARLPPATSDAAFSMVSAPGEVLQTGVELDQALKTVPGFSLFRRTSTLGANPTTQGVSLRSIAGSGASRALVTLDGVPQNDPFGGWVIWTALPPDSIGGAQIVRGAGAGPYGAGALTGVVALSERTEVAGGVAGEIVGGSEGYRRVDLIAAHAEGGTSELLSLSGQSSDGWIPVRAGRGPVDRPLDLSAFSGSARVSTELGASLITGRAAVYDEVRGAGLFGAGSTARGFQTSLTWAEAPTPTAWGFRLQGWVSGSDLVNRSVSTSPDRQTATPANTQYATPAIGLGANAALRRADAHTSVEFGVDVRVEEGESRELFSYVSGAFTKRRIAGGDAAVGGVYVEASRTSGPWLVAGGVRLDEWSNSDAHRTETPIAGGAPILDLHPQDRSGTLPSARLGVRRDLSEVWGGGVFWRTAAYTGFRTATLNELHRPFRVGNTVTEANPALEPERLYGAETGIGRDRGALTWDLTAFVSKLDNAITNVTLGRGPATFPIAGFVPAGGLFKMRENAGAVNAAGIEADSRWAITPTLSFTAALAYTHSRVDGGDQAPQLTGLKPALTAPFTATAGVDWRPLPALTLNADARYETARFDDDLNTLRLAPAATVDVRAEWAFTGRLSAFVALDNLFDAAVQTAQAADHTLSYDAPRMVRIGVRLRG